MRPQRIPPERCLGFSLRMVSEKAGSSLGPPDYSIAPLCDVSAVRLIVNCENRRDLCRATKSVVVHQRSHGNI